MACDPEPCLVPNKAHGTARAGTTNNRTHTSQENWVSFRSNKRRKEIAILAQKKNHPQPTVFTLQPRFCTNPLLTGGSVLVWRREGAGLLISGLRVRSFLFRLQLFWYLIDSKKKQHALKTSSRGCLVCLILKLWESLMKTSQDIPQEGRAIHGGAMKRSGSTVHNIILPCFLAQGVGEIYLRPWMTGIFLFIRVCKCGTE